MDKELGRVNVSNARSPRLRALPSFAGSVTRRSHTAGLAAFSKVRLINFVDRDRISSTIHEFEIYGFP